MLVQDFLRTASLDALALAHGVYGSLSRDGRRVSLNYDQIEAKDSDLLASQCRGLILARADGAAFTKDAPPGDTVVVARPFDRFFNHGQNGADAGVHLGQPGTRVFEKLDGTLCIVYFYEGAWRVATRSVPEADQPVDGFGTHTFRTLFDAALAGNARLADLDRHTLDAFGAEYLREGFTYCFELTGPYNRVVVAYASLGLHLLGIRETATGEETCPTDPLCDEFPLAVAPSYPVDNLSDLLAFVAERDPQASEGVVVRSASFDRIKVKSPAYVALHALKASIASPRRLLEIVLLGRLDDVKSVLPADTVAMGERFAVALTALAHRYDRLYAEAIVGAHGAENVRKEVALFAQRGGHWVPAFMERFTGRCVSFRDFIEKRKGPDGGFPDTLLDNLIEMLAAEPIAEAA